MAAATRDPITCHVLDTTTGRPAAGVAVSLNHIITLGQSDSEKGPSFSARTDADGRVTTWHTNDASLPDYVSHLRSDRDLAHAGYWRLRFRADLYYAQKGVDAFFPFVDLRIKVKDWGEHYHVPLLLGPYNYTTYRGS